MTRPNSSQTVSLLTSDELEAVGTSLSNTGFLLEHRVHHALQAAGFNARLGALYGDSDSGSAREMDVIVSGHLVVPGTGVTLWTSLVAECKAWASPIVVIGRPRSQVHPYRSFTEIAAVGGPLERLATEGYNYGDLVTYLQLRKLPSSVESFDFLGTQMVLLERGGASGRPEKDSEQPKIRYKATNDSVYNSVLLPLSKASAYERRRLFGSGDSLQETAGASTFVLSYPLLITSGPVVEAIPAITAPEPGGGDAPAIVEVREVGWTRLIRQFDDPNLPSTVIVEVVQEASLAQWVEERAHRFLAEVGSRIEQAHTIFAAHVEGSRVDRRKLDMVATQWKSART